MARKKIQSFVRGHTPVNIYRDSEWNEYIVRIPGRPSADYFTTDKEDAIQTARRMSGGFAGLRKGWVKKKLVKDYRRTCAKGSVRTVKSGKARILVCCPKGKRARTGRCRVGLRAISIDKPKGR